MASEIQATFGLSVVNGTFKDALNRETYLVNEAAIGGDSLVVSVGTSEQDLAFPDVSTLGYAYLRNTDPTNFITYGPKSGGSMVLFGKLKAGEFAWVRLAPGITFRAKADTAACKLFMKVYQD